MPRIAGVYTATPRYSVTQNEAKEFARAAFKSSHEIERLLPVFDNADIDTRRFVVDVDWFASPHTFTEVNDRYIVEALDLTVDVVEGLAKKCKIGTEAFDAII